MAGPDDAERTNNKRVAKAYWRGMRDGVRRFAWWKNGEQFVGSCGTTLKKALEDIYREETR